MKVTKVPKGKHRHYQLENSMIKDCYAHGDSLVRQIKTYVISLRESTRNPALFEQLETQGFAPSVIRAVDGRAGLGALDPNQMDLVRTGVLLAAQPLARKSPAHLVTQKSRR